MSKKSLNKEMKKAKKLIGEATKHVSSEQKKTAELMAECWVAFQGMGAECGVEIAKVARELHPDAYFIFPLYRGCIVIPKQEYTGSLHAILYHDPHWMGWDEVTTENLPKFKNELAINGQRSGQDYELNGVKLEEIDFTEFLFLDKIHSEAGWEYVKEKDPTAIGLCFKDIPESEVIERMDRIFWTHVEKRLGINKDEVKAKSVRRKKK